MRRANYLLIASRGCYFYCLQRFLLHKAIGLEAGSRGRNCLYLVFLSVFSYLIYLQMLYFDWLNCLIKKKVLNIAYNFFIVFKR